MSDNKTTSYLIRGIDKTVWRQFRARCIMAGFNSANECLNKLINMYVRDKINVKN